MTTLHETGMATEPEQIGAVTEAALADRDGRAIGTADEETGLALRVTDERTRELLTTVVELLEEILLTLRG